MKEKLTKDDWKAIQQPLDYKKTGRVNPEFDKHWGHKGNPFWGTDRDPDRKRVEKIKIKNEYEQFKHEMSPKERAMYEKHL